MLRRRTAGVVQWPTVVQTVHGGPDATGLPHLSRDRPRFSPEYRAYRAFVSDPDGNNIKAVDKDAG